jgi:hypothetical protein
MEHDEVDAPIAHGLEQLAELRIERHLLVIPGEIVALDGDNPPPSR